MLGYLALFDWVLNMPLKFSSIYSNKESDNSVILLILSNGNGTQKAIAKDCQLQNRVQYPVKYLR